MSLVGAIATASGSVVAGRLAEQPDRAAAGALALCVVGGALVDTVAKTIWAAWSTAPRAGCAPTCSTRRWRSRFEDLSEQAVGEVLDRIDDDTWEVGQLMRWGVWRPPARCWRPGRCGSSHPDVVAGVVPLPAHRGRRLPRRTPAAAARLAAQGDRGGRVDRSRRLHRGGRRRPRRPAHEPGPGLRPAPQRPGRRDRPPGARCRAGGRGPHHPPQRRAPAGVLAGSRRRGHRAGPAWRPVDRAHW